MKKMALSHRIVLLVFTIVLSINANQCCAAIAIITNPSSPLTDLTLEETSKIFLGKISKLEGGAAIMPIDQAVGNKERNIFYEKVVKKDAFQINAYWLRMLFSGKGRPPPNMRNNKQVVDFVASTPHSLGYVDQNAVDGSVQILFVVE